jgi:integrase
MGQAEAFKVKIESLMTGKLTGRMDDEVARWLVGLGDKMYAKLVAVGLVEPRVVQPAATKAPAAPEPCLGPFIDQYIGSRIDLKPGTLKFYREVRDRLLGFFEAGKLLNTITPGDADAWRLYLVKRGLAENTIRASCKKARQFFRSAVRSRLISENPFSDLKVSTKRNRDRDFFVSRQDAEKVLAACPDIEWKLIFALARYGGLRTPSETLRLRWADINWAQGKMLVRSSKTERHEDHESRFVPIFPELRGYLLEAFEAAEPGAEFVITKGRFASGNLGTQMLRIIERAGVKPWEKLFMNCRSSRETELCETWPEHVVCNWLGHSQVIARKHYLQVTDQHFCEAAGLENPAHKTAQKPRAADCDELQGTGQAGSINADLQYAAAGGAMSQSARGVPLGPEQPAATRKCNAGGGLRQDLTHVVLE